MLGLYAPIEFYMWCKIIKPYLEPKLDANFKLTLKPEAKTNELAAGPAGGVGGGAAN